MRSNIGNSLTNWRGLALVLVAALGLVAIVGSGGGAVFPDLCYSCGWAYTPQPPSVQVTPYRKTVLVGESVTFAGSIDSHVGGAVTLQWCRQDRGSSTCDDIPGANGMGYTVSGANLADNGARFGLTATDSAGSGQATAVLAVASSPGEVFGDGEFIASDWSLISVVAPTAEGPTYTASRVGSGGSPDAYLLLNYAFTEPQGSVRLYHGFLSAVFDPAASGALNVLDFSYSCMHAQSSAELAFPYAMPMIEQGGRKFVAKFMGWDWRTLCGSGNWLDVSTLSALGSEDFALADGPACAPGEPCPDFSAAGAPIRMGLASGVDAGPATTTGTVVQGIDNFRVTIWVH